MAIVVKEASKTPLAIAALAKGMADSYVNWNNSEQQHAQWEQEKTWRNEELDYQRNQRSQLSELATKLGDQDPGLFLNGEIGQMGAVSAASSGGDWSSFLSDTSAYNPLTADADAREYQMTVEFQQRQAGILPPDPLKDSIFKSLYARPKALKGENGMETHTVDSITGDVTGTYEGGQLVQNPNTRTITMPNKEVLTPEMIQQAAAARNVTPADIIKELEAQGGI
jgi:hypothetical protein